MPPWTSRLLSSSAAANSSSHSTSTASPLHAETSPNKYERSSHTPSNPSNQDLQDKRPLQSAPSQPQPSGRRHGRSISHPFPSFLGGAKKVDKRSGQREGAALDTADEEVTSHSMGSSSKGFFNPPQRALQNPVPPPGEKDLRTGHCMTCDSVVRWPRDLRTFRCTVCLCINDLDVRHENARPNTASTKPGTHPGPQGSQKGKLAGGFVALNTDERQCFQSQS